MEQHLAMTYHYVGAWQLPSPTRGLCTVLFMGQIKITSRGVPVKASIENAHKILRELSRRTPTPSLATTTVRYQSIRAHSDEGASPGLARGDGTESDRSEIVSLIKHAWTSPTWP